MQRHTIIWWSKAHQKKLAWLKEMVNACHYLVIYWSWLRLNTFFFYGFDDTVEWVKTTKLIRHKSDFKSKPILITAGDVLHARHLLRHAGSCRFFVGAAVSVDYLIISRVIIIKTATIQNRHETWTWSWITGSFYLFRETMSGIGDSPFRRRREQVRWRGPT